MPVSVQDTVFQHVGNGVTTVFAYGCQVPTPTDLEVYLDDVLQTSGFTVAGIGTPTGGTVTFSVAPANLVQVRLERVIELERTTDYQQNGDFLSDVVDSDFDRIWMALQGQLSTLKRALVVPSSDTVLPNPLPPSADRAGKLLGFDSNGQPVAFIPSEQSAAALQLLLASAAGSSMVGFLQSGMGAVLRTMQDKGRERVSAADFGAVGDGVTINSNALRFAKQSLPAGGGIIELGVGTFLIDDDDCLNLNASGITLQGQGPGTIIKAKNSSALVTIVAITAPGCSVRNLVIDGNRDNGGTNAATSYGLFVSASNFDAEGVEVRNCIRIGAFVGSSSATPSYLTFRRCWIHDNGGNVNGGIGVGIYGGGTFLADNVLIDGCRIENNYNRFAGFPGDSTAINITGTSVTVNACFIKNNHNVQGGQVALTSDGSTGAPDGRFVVTNTIVVHDVAVAGENTTGIEIEGRKATVANCVIQSLNGDGVRFETSGGDSGISGNVIYCTATGVNLIQVGGDGVRKCMIQGNVVLAAITGISVQTNPGGVQVVDNYIDAAVATKIAGLGNCQLVRGNYGYQPPVTLNSSAGTSPYEWPLLNYDAFYVLVTANGLVSHNVYGVNVSNSVGVPIPVKAGQLFSSFWAGTAPVYSICPQQ